MQLATTGQSVLADGPELIHEVSVEARSWKVKPSCRSRSKRLRDQSCIHKGDAGGSGRERGRDIKER